MTLLQLHVKIANYTGLNPAELYLSELVVLLASYKCRVSVAGPGCTEPCSALVVPTWSPSWLRVCMGDPFQSWGRATSTWQPLWIRRVASSDISEARLFIEKIFQNIFGNAAAMVVNAGLVVLMFLDCGLDNFLRRAFSKKAPEKGFPGPSSSKIKTRIFGSPRSI